MTAGTYLLHFEQPAPWREANPPRHYLGRSKDVAARIEAHATGRGGRFTQGMHRLGISFTLVRQWPVNTWDFERKLKGRGGSRLCPVCQGKEIV